MKITLVQTYEMEVPKEYENSSKLVLVNDINSMYDMYGKETIKRMTDDDHEYISTVLTEIDGEPLVSELILDGQPRDEEIK